MKFLRDAVLELLRVPPAPDPPPGSPASVTAFRASVRFFRYRLTSWAIRQALAFFGLVAFFVFQSQMLPDDDLFALLDWLEAFAFVAFFVQLVWSYFLIRIDWEQRWYLVTDTALRIREGVFRVNEQTMTVANIQNMRVSQGPVQRLFGIADLEVQTAGGGGRQESGNGDNKRTDLHVGLLRGLEDAPAVRDRIRRAVGRQRDAGLGDPDDAVAAERESVPSAIAAPRPGDEAVIAAARRLVDESRRLRAGLASGG